MEAWTDLEGLDVRETDTLTSKCGRFETLYFHCLNAGCRFSKQSCSEESVLGNLYSITVSSRSGHSLWFLGVRA